jgi:DNA primase
VQGHIYDRFRKRVMFPIANESGRIIAFTARTLATGGEAEKAGPKYLNSPETPLYSKGQVLFNLDKAKTAIRQLEFALLVEGQMDCISVFMRGIQNVIATSGTAFTEQQVALLKRHLAQPPNKPQVVANFDPDLAGKNAAAKTIDLLAAEGFKIRIAVLEDGLDPDRFIRERGVEAYARAIRGARERRIFFIERARELFPGAGIDQKISQVEYLHPLIENSRDPLEKELFIEDAAQKLGIDPAVLRERFRRSMQGRRDRNEMRAEVRPSGITEVERVLLRALATQAECWGVAAEAVTEHPEWFEHLASFAALAALAAQPAPGQAGHLEPIAAVENPVQRALLAQVLLQEGDPPEESAVHGALHGLHLRRLENEQRTLRGEIGEAERRGDWAEVAVLSQRKLAVDREIRNLHQ